MSSFSATPINPAPPPWTLKGTIYAFIWYMSSSSADSLPAFAYSPLEASSTFASQKPKGGIAMVQIIRYTESPVGPYDELVIIPGRFEYESNELDAQGERKKESNLKVSRIYVSQEKTCYNGRQNWNLPKHLARFIFTPLPNNGGMEILVFPHDTTPYVTESQPSCQPFFRGIYRPISYLPSFNCSTSMTRYLGLDLHLVQPPLPEGKGSLGELPGTERWCKVLPVEYSSETSLGWWDLRQDGGKGTEATEQDPLLGDDDRVGDGEQAGTTFENWWPSFGRWRIGLKMEDTTILFDKEIIGGDSIPISRGRKLNEQVTHARLALQAAPWFTPRLI